MLWRWWAALAVLLLALGRDASALAQAEVGQVRIVRLDAAAFPEVDAYFVALDADGRPEFNLSGLRLSEAGQPVSSFEVDPVPAGLELVLVLDANASFEQQDEPGGPSRREIATAAITAFAEGQMDPGGRDRVSILAPDGAGGRFLGEPGLAQPAAVAAAAGSYEPAELGPTPLQAMLRQALAQAAAGAEEGRLPAVALFSDGGLVGEQLDYESLLAEAAPAGVYVYALLLGSQADFNEVNNLARLANRTGGRVRHLPEAAEAEPIFAEIRDRSLLNRARFTSAVRQSGRYTVTVSLRGVADEAAYSLELRPPAVSLAAGAEPIRRLAAGPETALAELEPAVWPLTAEISWPDGHPRGLAEATLLVDGAPASSQSRPLVLDGRLTFNWDISERGAGTVLAQVRVTDALGLSAESPAVPHVIEVIRPQATATLAPAVAAQPAAAEGPVASDARTERIRLGLLGLAAAGLLLAPLPVLALARRGRRRRQPPPLNGVPETEAAASPRPLAAQEREEQAPAAAGLAYLEALAHAPEHPRPIPLDGANLALGRDYNRSQITFGDASVARLHARILANGWAYRIQDEASETGTYVNFERLGMASRPLADGDHIHLGRVHLRFRQPAARGA